MLLPDYSRVARCSSWRGRRWCCCWSLTRTSRPCWTGPWTAAIRARRRSATAASSPSPPSSVQSKSNSLLPAQSKSNDILCSVSRNLPHSAPSESNAVIVSTNKAKCCLLQCKVNLNLPLSNANSGTYTLRSFYGKWMFLRNLRSIYGAPLEGTSPRSFASSKTKADIATNLCMNSFFSNLTLPD